MHFQQHQEAWRVVSCCRDLEDWSSGERDSRSSHHREELGTEEGPGADGGNNCTPYWEPKEQQAWRAAGLTRLPFVDLSFPCWGQ